MSLIAATACAGDPANVEPGVPYQLAELRKQTISDVRYDVSFNVPAALTERVTGSVAIRFQYTGDKQPVVLDFDTGAGRVTAVRVAGKPAKYRISEGHISVPLNGSGTEREISVDFVSSDAALNRQDEFFYSLFVPDRAATAFPCFNQPNLKGRFTLSLTVPEGWSALANGALLGTMTRSDEKHTYNFAESLPISTYLFAFTAGRYSVEEARLDGRTFRMYHRETDRAKVARNSGAIFELHAAALKWLEEYTGIEYPFPKFDFVAVPAFQFGGMEHPGAILYRAASLLLDEAPSTNQLLGRASVIAHETSHMWFGDLVTMDWFNDVWMKEVFANFMAAKIVAPSFPELNHDLRFVLAHHPAAYEVDRSEGANAIRQPLLNLKDAGSLYGAIIYQKAPIVMRQLEKLVGETTLRDGLREYLKKFSFGNATWSELIGILDSMTDEDLVAWSDAWVEKAGRPLIDATFEMDAARRMTELRVTSRDPIPRTAVLWNQRMFVALGYGDSVRQVSIHLRDALAVTRDVAGWARPDFVLPGSDGVAYGDFRLDEASRKYLLQNISRLRDPIVRTDAWLALWESLLNAQIPPREFITVVLRALPQESDELIVPHLLGLLRTSYWSFVARPARDSLAAEVEAVLWRELERASSPSRKRAYFDALVSVTLSPQGTERLARVWRMQDKLEGLPFADDQYIDIAKALAVRDYPGADSVLNAQLARITNADRKARFQFVLPSLSGNGQVRDSVFASFADVANRRRESWVLEAQAALNHPLRAEHAASYVGRSLKLVEEIQRTGDIFFPLRWLTATLGGHQSAAVANEVRSFLRERPDYPPQLRAKVLQAGDELFRAVAILAK